MSHNPSKEEVFSQVLDTREMFDSTLRSITDLTLTESSHCKSPLDRATMKANNERGKNGTGSTMRVEEGDSETDIRQKKLNKGSSMNQGLALADKNKMECGHVEIEVTPEHK